MRKDIVSAVALVGLYIKFQFFLNVNNMSKVNPSLTSVGGSYFFACIKKFQKERAEQE